MFHEPDIRTMQPLRAAVLKTLLYYDIWEHPLTAGELYTYLPVNSMTPEEFHRQLRTPAPATGIREYQGYFFTKDRTAQVVETRRRRERHARGMWVAARISTHIIKRFPFVRAVFVSGDLSKNVTGSKSDVDFLIITEPGRLWIARTLLILFKKVFLLNSKKFFCLNYFATSDHLALDRQNLYLATEVATLKPLFNSGMFRRYLEANSWITRFFPNVTVTAPDLSRVNDRPSMLQKLLEIPFRLLPADALDAWLMNKMKKVWKKRYPQFDQRTSNRILRTTPHESRVHISDYEETILRLYADRLKAFGVQE